METEVERDPALLLLSDELMEEEGEDDDESEIYEMEDDQDEDFEDEIIAGTPQPPYSDEMDDASFYDENASDEGLVQENPFEPVYPAAAAGLLFDDSISAADDSKGIVLEAVSLDNILPAGSRRRRC